MKSFTAASLLLLGHQANALTAEIWNTFQEEETTGGLETIYSYSTATIGDGVDFTLFPPNPPGTPAGGFYDIDVDETAGTITWTLKDNLGAGHLVVGEGSYDRYYLILEDAVASATITEGSDLNPKVSVPAYEDKSTIADLFGSGLPFPTVLENNVILMEVQPGGNMTELEQVITVDYTYVSGSTDMSTGVGAVSIWNTFEEIETTNGAETIYSYSEGTISNNVEFSSFPPNPPGTPEGGFYDIDITLDSEDATKATITWTLVDNLGAGHLHVGVGSADRYYVVLDQAVASAVVVGTTDLNPKVTVPFYEETPYIVDLFQSGLTFPAVLDNKVIVLEVLPGGDMTELGQVVTVEVTLESAYNVPSTGSRFFVSFGFAFLVPLLEFLF